MYVYICIYIVSDFFETHQQNTGSLRPFIKPPPVEQPQIYQATDSAGYCGREIAVPNQRPCHPIRSLIIILRNTIIYDTIL